MHPSVLEISQEQINGLFKIIIIFDQLLIKRNVGYGRTAADAVGIDLCN